MQIVTPLQPSLAHILQQIDGVADPENENPAGPAHAVEYPDPAGPPGPPTDGSIERRLMRADSDSQPANGYRAHGHPVGDEELKDA